LNDINSMVKLMILIEMRKNERVNKRNKKRARESTGWLRVDVRRVEKQQEFRTASNLLGHITKRYIDKNVSIFESPSGIFFFCRSVISTMLCHFTMLEKPSNIGALVDEGQTFYREQKSTIHAVDWCVQKKEHLKSCYIILASHIS